MERERFFDPNQMDGGFSDGQLQRSHDTRTISEGIRGHAAEDGAVSVTAEPMTEAAVQEQYRHDEAVTQISERGAEQRVRIGRGFAKFVERTPIEEAMLREAARRQTVFAKAEAQLHRHNSAGAYAESFDDRGYVPPEQDAPDVQAPKPATGFKVASKSRFKKGERAEGRVKLQRQIKLDGIRDAIRARMNDRPTPQRDLDVGAQMEAAQELLDRGDFDGWVKSIPMSRSAAFGALAKYKESKKPSQ